MDKEKKNGLMVRSMKATTNSAKKMDLESFYGLTDLHTKETSETIIFTDTENTNGPMVENSQETGYAIRCMEVVFSLGLMAEDIKVSTTMTKNKVMEFSRGQMEENTMGHG